MSDDRERARQEERDAWSRYIRALHQRDPAARSLQRVWIDKHVALGQIDQSVHRKRLDEWRALYEKWMGLKHFLRTRQEAQERARLVRLFPHDLN